MSDLALKGKPKYIIRWATRNSNAAGPDIYRYFQIVQGWEAYMRRQKEIDRNIYQLLLTCTRVINVRVAPPTRYKLNPGCGTVEYEKFIVNRGMARRRGLLPRKTLPGKARPK